MTPFERLATPICERHGITFAQLTDGGRRAPVIAAVRETIAAMLTAGTPRSRMAIRLKRDPSTIHHHIEQIRKATS